jgi:hypothetical protein
MSRAQADAHAWRAQQASGGRRVLELTLGRAVYAQGRRGVIESTAFSVATEQHLITVAFSPRERLTFRADELSLA